MNRQLIEEVIQRIKTELPEFKKVGLFNDDFTKQDEGEKAGLNFPAIFLSFPEGVIYENDGSGVQRSEDFLVRFVMSEKFLTDKKVLEIFDLKQKVYRVFNGWKPSKGSTFRRYSEQPDENRSGFYVFEQVYITKLIDDETFIENKRIPVTLTGLKVEGDLLIDPRTVDGIRTDDEFKE